MKSTVRRRRSLVLAGVTLCAVSAQALALPPPPYAVVDLGHSFIGLKSAGSELPGVETLDSDRRDTGFGVTLGWRFSEHLAAEGSFLELGEASYDVEDSGTVSDATVRVRSAGLLLSVAGTWPLHDKWSLEGRAGAYLGKNETRVRGVMSGPLGGSSFNSLVGSDSKVGLAAGVGVVTSFNDTWGMRVGYDYLDKAFGKNAGRVSVGVRFNWP
jgi:opacity protein-like surface antigen